MNLKKAGLIILIMILFSGCTFYDINKRKYNDLSRQHNQIANEALLKKNEAVDNYNSSKYEEAKKSAEESKELFTHAREISTENLANAVKIKDVPWLTDYQNKVILSERYWIEIIDIVVRASNAQVEGNLSDANRLVKELEAKVPKYESLQKEIDQIEENNKDFFQGQK